MMLATLASQRAQATPGASGATCPACDSPVIPKCGQVNIWHWAHARGGDCDPWYEPMSEWHLSWQSCVPQERREVVIGNHRADIVTARRMVVEIQHSHLSTDEIAERERHYGPMIWVFDAISAATPADGDYFPRLDIREKANTDPTYRTFRWKHARKSVAACKRTVFLDLGDDLLLVRRIYPEAPVGGWGYLWTRQQVIDAINEPLDSGDPVTPADHTPSRQPASTEQETSP